MTSEQCKQISLTGDFDTTRLLSAADAVDVIRNALGGGLGGLPLKFRDDVLRLHQMAMHVFNDGQASGTEAMLELAFELQAGVDDMMAALGEVQDTLTDLSATNTDDQSDDDED